MNLTRESVPNHFDAVEAACVSDEVLTRIEGGFGGDSTTLLILAVILIGAGIFVKNTAVGVTPPAPSR